MQHVRVVRCVQLVAMWFWQAAEQSIRGACLTVIGTIPSVRRFDPDPEMAEEARLPVLDRLLESNRLFQRLLCVSGTNEIEQFRPKRLSCYKLSHGR